METIHKSQTKAKKSYDQGKNPFNDFLYITKYCLTKLSSTTKKTRICKQNNKTFWIYEKGKNYSRPIQKKLFISDSKKFESNWKKLLNAIDSENHSISLKAELINKILYSTIMSFSACYDLWKPRSRKTPGTYFEVLLGSVIGELLSLYKRSKYIPIPESAESVSTDIVFCKEDTINLVIPAKITTRERIVQPYAHQRILDSVFSEGEYISVLICVSETQRDRHVGVKEICVPGTIKLFQTHLSKLGGIYYLDPPTRYLEPDLKEIIEINSLGHLLSNGLSKHI